MIEGDPEQWPGVSRDVGSLLLHEDEAVRVWLLELAPGDATQLHAHDYDYVFVVTQAAPALCEYVDGSTERQADEVGDMSYRYADTPHRLVNLGDSRYQNVVIELKARPRRERASS